MLLDSVAEFLKLKDSLSSEDLEKKHPEFVSAKPTSYFRENRNYVKNIDEKSDGRTMRIDKSDKVSDIVQQLVDSGDCYLRHWKHVDNTCFTKDQRTTCWKIYRNRLFRKYCS